MFCFQMRIEAELPELAPISVFCNILSPLFVFHLFKQKINKELIKFEILEML